MGLSFKNSHKMSEKRKPRLTIVAKKQGKRPCRIELYPGQLWPDKFSKYERKFRVRMNRRWVCGDRVFTVTEVLKQLRGWLTKR